MPARGSPSAIDNVGELSNAPNYGVFRKPHKKLPPRPHARYPQLAYPNASASTTSTSSSSAASFGWSSDSPPRVSLRKKRRLETERTSQENKSFAPPEESTSAEDVFPEDGKLHTPHEQSTGVDMLQLRLKDAAQGFNAERSMKNKFAIDWRTSEARQQDAVRKQFGDVISEKNKQIKAIKDATTKIQRQHDNVVTELKRTRLTNSSLQNSLKTVQNVFVKSQTNLNNVTAELSHLRAIFKKSEAKRMLDENAELKRQLEDTKKDRDRRRGEHLDRLSTTQLDDLRAQCRQALDNVDAECEQRRQCVICMDTRAQVVVMPCWHLCMCEGCLEKLKSDPSGERRCPKCRAFITAFNSPFMD